MADKTPAASGAVARPGVLSLNIREKAALYAAYMPFLKGGGIFIPTSRPYSLGEEVFMLLSLMDDPNRIAVQGKVVWITPDGGQGNRTQGIGVQFTLDDTGALLWRDKAGVRADVQRLVDMWTALLDEHGGPLLFGEFTVADAYFAPVCMRLHTYGLPVPTHIAAYVDRVRALPGVKAWIDEALAEKDFLAFEEPYRLRPQN